MDSDTRLKVLNTSLSIELRIKVLLASLLDISLDDSITLSNKASSLSFKTKIDLLTDIQALPRSDIKYFQYFMQLRNQFVHNIDAHSFETCVKYCDNLEKKLFELYPPSKSGAAKEAQLEEAFQRLVNDLEKSLHTLAIALRDKAYKEGRAEGYKNIFESFLEVITEYPNGKEISDRIIKLAMKKEN